MIRFLISVFVFLLLFSATPAQAHRQPEALTTIKFNSNTGKIEIIHRLHAHDLAQALPKIQGDDHQTLEALKTRALVSLHVEEHFQIIDQKTRQPIQLSLVGAELEGEHLYVYQEFDGELPSMLALRHDVLRALFPAQVNTINLTIGSDLHTLVFSGKDKWKTFSEAPNP